MDKKVERKYTATQVHEPGKHHMALDERQKKIAPYSNV